MQASSTRSCVTKCDVSSMPELQVLALCRFSYPTLRGSGFSSREKPGPYDARRLQRRLWIFEKICLPGIRSQTDKRFQVLILIGKGLLAPVKDRLKQLVHNVPEITICEEPDGQPHLDVCSAVVRRHRRADIDYTAELLLDDDDCMGANVIAELYEIFQRTHRLIDKEKRIEIDFCKGYAINVVGSTCHIKEVLAPHWTCAQAIVQRMPTRLTIANFHHFRFWRQHICISSAKEAMFVRAFHGSNDTEGRWGKIAGDIPAVEANQLCNEIGARFGIVLQPSEEDRDALVMI